MAGYQFITDDHGELSPGARTVAELRKFLAVVVGHSDLDQGIARAAYGSWGIFAEAGSLYS